MVVMFKEQREEVSKLQTHFKKHQKIRGVMCSRQYPHRVVYENSYPSIQHIPNSQCSIFRCIPIQTYVYILQKKGARQNFTQNVGH